MKAIYNVNTFCFSVKGIVFYEIFNLNMNDLKILLLFFFQNKVKSAENYCILFLFFNLHKEKHSNKNLMFERYISFL